ncbi:hypothetical protein [Emticicia soli]|uniref:Uncharacterized protein n=1 Tax=Emticicia soli TaxID=2027878 RepID=A0ABW5J355_9BACT
MSINRNAINYLTNTGYSDRNTYPLQANQNSLFELNRSLKNPQHEARVCSVPTTFNKVHTSSISKVEETQASAFSISSITHKIADITKTLVDEANKKIGKMSFAKLEEMEELEKTLAKLKNAIKPIASITYSSKNTILFIELEEAFVSINTFVSEIKITVQFYDFSEIQGVQEKIRKITESFWDRFKMMFDKIVREIGKYASKVATKVSVLEDTILKTLKISGKALTGVKAGWMSAIGVVFSAIEFSDAWKAYEKDSSLENRDKLFTALAALVTDVVLTIAVIILTIIGGTAALLVVAIITVITLVNSMISLGAKLIYDKDINLLADLMLYISNSISNIAKKVFNYISNFYSSIKDTCGKIWDSIKNRYEDFATRNADKILDTRDFFNKYIP